MARPSLDELVHALRAAGAAHHDYESNVLRGEHDEQWPGWYAAYTLGRLEDFVSPTSLSRWLSDAPSSDDWARSTAKYILEALATAEPEQ